jgi:hypothetical protein
LATISARPERQDDIERTLDAKNQVERISVAEKLRLQPTSVVGKQGANSFDTDQHQLLFCSHELGIYGIVATHFVD